MTTPQPRLASRARRGASLTALGGALVLAGCAAEDAVAPRVLPTEASRGVGAAATWTWSGYATPYGPKGWLTAINDSGHVAGSNAHTSDGDSYPFASYGPRYADYKILNVWGTWPPVSLNPLVINNSGDVLAYHDTYAHRVIGASIFLRSGFVDRLDPSGEHLPRAMNDNGVVGGSTSAAISGRGFLYSSKNFRDVTPPGWTGATVSGIDATGTIFGGSVRLVYGSGSFTNPYRTLSCAWLQRRGVNSFYNCVVYYGGRYDDAQSRDHGVVAINARGDAIGNVARGDVIARGYPIINGTFVWPAGASLPTVDPNVSRRWVAISSKGRLVGTEPAAAGRRIIVTRSPAGVTQLILDQGHGTPYAINSCGTIVGYAPIGTPAEDYYSVWTPSTCDK